MNLNKFTMSQSTDRLVKWDCKIELLFLSKRLLSLSFNFVLLWLLTTLSNHNCTVYKNKISCNLTKNL